MRKIIYLLLSTILFFGCKKSDTATNVTPKKTYTIEYKVSCIGQPSSQYTVYYIQNGVTYSKTLSIPSNQVSIDWITSFTASTGDYVSMSSSAPSPGSSGFTNSVFLYIKYDGNAFKSTNASWPSQASVNGNLP
jgi:hypothetical protein